MAINKEKLLPILKYQSKSLSLRPSITQSSLVGNDIIIASKLFSIKEKVLKITEIVQGSAELRVKENDNKKREEKRDRLSKIEEKLEKKEKGNNLNIKVPEIKDLGFLGRIKNFLSNILFGFIAYRLLDHLPQLIDFVQKAKPAFDFFVDFSGKLINGLITFVDWGYKAVDKTKEFLSDINGASLEKLFKTFEGSLNAFINAALITKLISGGSKRGPGGFEGGAGAGAGTAASRSLAKRIQETALGKRTVIPKRTISVAPRETLAPTRQLVGAAKVSPELSGVRTITGVGGRADIADPAVRKFVEKLEKRASTGELAAPGRRIGKKMIGRDPIVKMAGEVAESGVAKTATKRLGRFVPVIGPLIDFIISTVVFKEDPGRAAAGAVGSGLGSWIGAALAGTGTFGIGAGLGFFIGGWVGDLIGRALYDVVQTITVQGLIQKKATGGPVTRSGRLPSSAKRTIQKQAPRKITYQQTKLSPGADIGGQKQIEKVFPKSDKPEQINPLGFMKSSYEKVGKVPFFSGLLSLVSKAYVGQKPSQLDYKLAAQGLNSWMNYTFSQQAMRTGGAFAEGGLADSSMFMSGSDMTNIIQTSIEEFVSPKINEITKDLMKNIALREIEKKGTEQPALTDGEITGLQGSAKEYYDYLISKGISPNNAMGLVLNIARESSFRPGVQIIDINGQPSGGLFQWNAGRFTNMTKAVPDWRTNWKGQIDYALAEPQGAASGSNYLATKFNSPMEAAVWWMEKWERVADPARDTIKMQKILDTWTAQGMKQGEGPPATLGNIPGNLSAAQQLAASMGLTMTSFNTGQHAKGSLHYQNRAMDFSNGVDTPQQKAFANALISKYGTSIKQLIYTPLGFGISDGKQVPLSFWGDSVNDQHYNHVHVAFAKGGRVSRPTRAIIGEKGPEFVFDADTTKGLDQMMPNLLEHLNAAKNKSELMRVLMSYAGYENVSNQTIAVQLPPPEVVYQEVPVPISSGFGGMSASSSDPYESLASMY